jgi:hypothetical protein
MGQPSLPADDPKDEVIFTDLRAVIVTGRVGPNRQPRMETSRVGNRLGLEPWDDLRHHCHRQHS